MIYFILGVILVGLLILAAPMSLGYDSVEKWFKVKWLGLTMTKRLEAEETEKIEAEHHPEKKDSRPGLMRRLWRRAGTFGWN